MLANCNFIIQTFNFTKSLLATLGKKFKCLLVTQEKKC